MNNMNNKPIASEKGSGYQSWNAAGSGGFSENEVAEAAYIPETQRNHTAMILLGICVLCMLGVYMFGLRQRPKEATAQEKALEAEVDTYLAKLVSIENGPPQKIFKDTENMVQAFYEYPSKQQVAADDLKKNPFYRYMDTGNDKAEEQARNLTQQEKELKRQVSLLQLQSVLLGGAGPKCLIDGHIYSLGQTIQSTFNIKAINKENVILMAGNLEFVLQM